MKKFVFLAAFILCGCSAPNTSQKAMNSWLNKTELELVRQIGTPDKTYDAAGARYIAYRRARPYTMYGVTKGCETTFEISRGIITHVSATGNDC